MLPCLIAMLLRNHFSLEPAALIRCGGTAKRDLKAECTEAVTVTATGAM
jgi:hypothetical protein